MLTILAQALLAPVALVAVLGCATLRSAEEGSDDVVFEIDISPGEGAPFVRTDGADVILRSAPRPESPARFTGRLVLAQPVAADSARYQTLEVAHFHARDTASVLGISYGARRHLTRDEYYSPSARETTFHIPSGTTFEFLQWRAEGSCFVRIDGLIVAADTCPAIYDKTFVQMSEPRTRLWLYIVTPQGSGWLDMDTSGIALEKRLEG